MPNRQYDKKDGAKGYWDFITTPQGDYALKNWIVAEYEKTVGGKEDF